VVAGGVARSQKEKDFVSFLFSLVQFRRAGVVVAWGGGFCPGASEKVT